MAFRFTVQERARRYAKRKLFYFNWPEYVVDLTELDTRRQRLAEKVARRASADVMEAWMRGYRSGLESARRLRNGRSK